MQNEFSCPIRVYIEDTDAGGIVFYVNYLKYMERARTEFFRSLGFPKPAVLDEGLILVVALANVTYKKSARLDEALLATAKPCKLARTYIVFEQQVIRDNDILTEGIIKVACVEKATMRPRPIPERIMTCLHNVIEC